MFSVKPEMEKNPDGVVCGVRGRATVRHGPLLGGESRRWRAGGAHAAAARLAHRTHTGARVARRASTTRHRRRRHGQDSQLLQECPKRAPDLGGKLIDKMKEYDKDNIPAQKDKIVAYIGDGGVHAGTCGGAFPLIDTTREAATPRAGASPKSAKACTAMCMWVQRHAHQYHQVSVMVEPKKKLLAEATAELEETMQKLAEAQARSRRPLHAIDATRLGSDGRVGPRRAATATAPSRTSPTPSTRLTRPHESQRRAFDAKPSNTQAKLKAVMDKLANDNDKMQLQRDVGGGAARLRASEKIDWRVRRRAHALDRVLRFPRVVLREACRRC